MANPIIDRMRKASEAEGQLRDHGALLFSGNRPCINRKFGEIGLELEIEGRKLPNLIDYITPTTEVDWTVDNDGSLRGEAFEYITNGPILVQEAKPMLDALWKGFEDKGSELRLSNRCSTHVHVNVSNLSVATITSFMSLFVMVEELVTAWCGRSRVSNPFCLRVMDSQDSIDRWYAMCCGECVALDRGNKYSAMNLKPIWKRGSLEFRALRGSDKPETVLKWIKFLWALRTEAVNMYPNPLTLAQVVSAIGAKNVIEQVVDNHGLHEFWEEVCNHPDNAGTVERKIREGFYLVQPLMFLRVWQKLENVENEPLPTIRSQIAKNDIKRRQLLRGQYLQHQAGEFFEDDDDLDMIEEDD